MIAAELGHTPAVDLLLARGADKSLKDKQGKTAGDLTSLTALRDKLAAPELVTLVEILVDLQAGEILGERSDIVRRGRLHEV